MLNFMENDGTSLLIASRSHKHKALSREHLTREINKSLKAYHTNTETYRSHSFRKGLITYFWKKTGEGKGPLPKFYSP